MELNEKNENKNDTMRWNINYIEVGRKKKYIYFDLLFRIRHAS